MITVSDFPKYRGKMEYVCLGCQARFDINELYYTCPHCGGVFLLEDTTFDSLLEFPPSYWQGLFDKRAATRVTALRGVLRFYELMAPVVEEEDIVYLGEGHTPIIAANDALTELVGAPFYYKNDGQNPSASFKDRGMIRMPTPAFCPASATCCPKARISPSRPRVWTRKSPRWPVPSSWCPRPTPAMP